MQPEIKLDGERNDFFYLHLDISSTYGFVINSGLSIPAVGDKSGQAGQTIDKYFDFTIPL